MVRRKKGRPLDGIVLLNKPSGRSSNDLLQQVKRCFYAQKAGHTGALDPLATGMLPICFGEGTKFAQYLLDADKRYRVTARLGERTDTSDSEGQIIQKRAINFSDSDLQSALNAFRGESMQIPSMYSALKHQGRPLYEYARQGIDIERPARPIHVYELQVLDVKYDELTLEIECSKGTYIRTIIDDLGERLGCGAHVIALHRLWVAPYQNERMWTLEELEAERQIINNQEEQEDQEVFWQPLDKSLLPIDSGLEHLEVIHLQDALAAMILQGQPVQVFNAPEGSVRLTCGQNHEFIGIAQVDDCGQIYPKRLKANTA